MSWEEWKKVVTIEGTSPGWQLPPKSAPMATSLKGDGWLPL